MHIELQVDDIGIDLIENSPAYTYGDVPVYVADDRVIYTGEMPFTENTPLMAEDRVAGWVSASDYILDLDSELVVPGRGPVRDLAMRDYLLSILSKAQQRFNSGMGYAEAVRNIAI